MLNKFIKLPFIVVSLFSAIITYLIIVWHMTHGDFSGLGKVPVVFGIIAVAIDTIIILILGQVDKFLKSKNIISLIYFISIRTYLLYQFIEPNYYPDIRNFVIIMVLCILLGILHTGWNIYAVLAKR